MSRSARGRRRAIGCLIALLGSAIAACGSAPPPPERIVLIVIDALRRDALGCYGGAGPTPHLDALADRGVAVPGVSSAFHQTTASMGALFTGRTPSLESGDPAQPLPWTSETWCGLARFAAPGAACIPESLPTLPERVRAAGYWTIGVVANELLHRPAGFHRGFDDLVEVGAAGPAPDTAPWQGRVRQRVHAEAIAAIGRRPRDRFFLYVHYMDARDYVDRGISYPDGVREADAGVGALVAFLDANGLLEDSVVVVTADHGEQLGERHPPFPRRAIHFHFGNPSYEEVLAVPLLVVPGSALAGRPPRNTIEIHDWLLRVAGAAPAEPAPADLADGEHFLSEVAFQTYRRGGWKSSFARNGRGVVLFDLSRDPGEARNLAGEHPDLVASHRERIGALTRALAATGERRAALSELERARLEALGYLRPEPPEPQ